MDDQQLLRFNRQILLPQIDIAGQQKLANAEVTIVGLGGLGCPAAMYLAAAGVGRLNLIDYDKVELTNLQRQLAYTDQDIGRPKVIVMAELIAKLNSDCKVKVFERQFNSTLDNDSIQSTHVILDATDNLESRKAVNQFSQTHQIPLVFAAAIRMEGQLTVFDPGQTDSPCFECVFGKTQLNESCSQSGILGTVVGTMGLMQATEAIKIIVGIGQLPVGRLQIYDALAADWQTIKIKKRSDCPICVAYGC